MVDEKAAKLDRLFERIKCYKVVVEESNRRRHQEKFYRVHSDITIPGKELTVSRGQMKGVYGVYIVIRDALTLQADSAQIMYIAYVVS
jgi:ribosome-associated translation inhibitor RaiA